MMGPRLSLHFLTTETIAVTITTASVFTLSWPFAVRLEGPRPQLGQQMDQEWPAGADHDAGTAVPAAKGYL